MTIIKTINYLENFPRVNNDREFVLRLEYQKNHIHLYNNETDKLIVELMAVSKEWIKKLQHYFYTGNNPFISELPFSNVAPNKTMTVKENLKLRSGEATTTSVLTVMSAGTRVKILTLGKQATIDGTWKTGKPSTVLQAIGCKWKCRQAQKTGTGKLLPQEQRAGALGGIWLSDRRG